MFFEYYLFDTIIFHYFFPNLFFISILILYIHKNNIF